MASSEQPIIIVKKKGGHGGHHGGAWKVAYADFVTAMMAFFLVMWIVGLSKPTRIAIASYFRDPVGFMKTSHGGKSPISDASDSKPDEGQSAPVIPKDGGVPGMQLKALALQFKEIEKAIQKEMEKTPEFRSLKDSVNIQLTDEGLRIELIEKTSSLFFDSGRADLKPTTAHLLRMIAQQLGKLQSPIVIEGHTDSEPLHGANGYSNWELSTDRANSARRAMDGHGLKTNQIMAVRGFADRKLRVPDNPKHFSNRRVSILVGFSAKPQ